MLWLAVSSITVIESSDGSVGYDYALINTDDGEVAHARPSQPLDHSKGSGVFGPF